MHESDHPPPFLPKVSVIVPIYNGEQDLPDLIDCLAVQTYPRDRIEYLLIDNNSSDRTYDSLLETAQKWQNQGLKFKVLSENKIQSSYAARNCGIKQATGEILVFTDADCRPSPDWIAQIISSFRDPHTGIVVGELKALFGESLLEKYADRVRMMSPHFLLAHPFYPYGQTANLAIRRLIFSQVGLFRPYLTTGGDADICWRIQQTTDWQLTFAPQAIVYHRHRNSLRELRSQWQRYGRSNRYLHDLHGVDLMPSYTHTAAVKRIIRWLFKDIPYNTLKMTQGKAKIIDLVCPPIDLLTYHARSQGQQTALLPPEAKDIEWLPSE